MKAILIWDSWDDWDTWDIGAEGVNEEARTRRTEKKVRGNGRVLPLEKYNIR